MKILTVIGARPQFIKAFIISRQLRRHHTEILVHTGQHYDYEMSQVFFDQLEIPAPDVNLNVGSGNHGAQTGAMLAGIEEIILREKPDWMLVYGDTNSTLAGALAAAKLHIPVAHVEAGLRSFNRRMPEELNRVLTDHISDLLFCPTDTAVSNLAAEGITRGVYQVGDVMHEALLFARDRASSTSCILQSLGLVPGGYLLATVHRAENTDATKRLAGIVEALNAAESTVILPVHPRTRKILGAAGLGDFNRHVRMIDPVSYLDMVTLEQNAKVILTDSGGVQKEAFWLGVPCVTLRNETEWVETVHLGWNKLAGADPQAIIQAVQEFQANLPACPGTMPPPDASRQICELLGAG